MKKNAALSFALAIVSLAVTSCDSGDQLITRADALNLLKSIETNRKASEFEDTYESFTTIDKVASSITTNYYSKVNATLDESTNTVALTSESKSLGSSSGEEYIYRYSKSAKYISTKVTISDSAVPANASLTNHIYLIKQYSTDQNSCYYEFDIPNKQYVRYESNYQSLFDARLNGLKSLAQSQIASKSEIDTAYNYFSSLPEKLLSTNEEEYRSKNENSVYLRATGNEGNVLTTNGTQKTYLTRFTDNTCVSSYLEAGKTNIGHVTTAENFSIGNSLVKYYPVVASTAKISVTACPNNASLIGEYSDDGNGGLLKDGVSFAGGYINYLTGEFYIGAINLTAKIKYDYEINQASISSYAASFDDFTPVDIPSSNIFAPENGWTEVDSI